MVKIEAKTPAKTTRTAAAGATTTTTINAKGTIAKLPNGFLQRDYSLQSKVKIAQHLMICCFLFSQLRMYFAVSYLP